MNNCKKLLISSAIATALGLSATAANSAAIVSMTLNDIDGDGAISGFRFTVPAGTFTPADNSFPTGLPGSLRFGDAAIDDCGGGAGTCAPLLFNTGEVGTDVFTSGFNFGGGGDFKPLIANPTGTGNTGGSVNAGVLDLTALDFGGFYNSPTFYLPPQDLADLKAGIPVATTPADIDAPIFPAEGAFTGGSSTGLDYYLDTFVDNGDGTYDFIIRWTSRISQGDPNFDGFVSNWRLEGTFDTNASVIPVPAAVWLFGSGLLGLVGVARRKKSS